MTSLKPFRPILKKEDMENGGNQKVRDAINAGIDHKKLKKQIRHLKGLDLKHANFEYLRTILMPFANGYSMSSTASNVGEPLYRAVRWPTKPTNVKQLSYPPEDKVKLGRANYLEKPIFYASAGCQSTIMELAPNQSDRIVISKWRTKQNLILFCVGYTENAFKGKVGIKRFDKLHFIKHHAENPRSRKKGNRLAHEFFAREFTKRVPEGKEWLYKISAVFSELTLNALSFGLNDAPAIEIAGIMYPSTPNGANADNVALKCSIADKYLDFVSVQYLEITKKIDNFQYEILGLDFADSLSDTGEIMWKNSFPLQLFPGTDNTIRHGKECIEILDKYNMVVVSIPSSQAASYNFKRITFN